MSKALVPVLTRAGLAAVVRAQGDGLQATISRVALGRGAKSGTDYVGYLPSKDATGLANEMQRVPLLSGSKLTAPMPGFRVLARVPEAEGPTGYWVREFGIFLSDGTLFALWSDPAFPLEYRTGLADLDLAFELFLTQVPIESITIAVNEPDIPDLAGALAALLREQTNHFIASLDMNERLISRGI